MEEPTPNVSDDGEQIIFDDFTWCVFSSFVDEMMFVGFGPVPEEGAEMDYETIPATSLQGLLELLLKVNQTQMHLSPSAAVAQNTIYQLESTAAELREMYNIQTHKPTMFNRTTH